MLIDDIDAELDRGRIEALLSQLEGRAQTFISTSRRAIANRYRNRASAYFVDRGRATREPGDDSITAARFEPARRPVDSPEGDLERAVREMIVDEENERNATF